MKPNASGMPGIVRSDSYGDLAYDFAANNLVTTFKERVTIFLDKPRLLIPMGADNGEKLRTPFRPENPQGRAAGCRRLYRHLPPSPAHTPRKTPRNGLVFC